MLLRSSLLALALVAGGAALAAAQDFGVMESPETVQRGTFKLVGHPMFVLGEGNADNELGVVLRGGYGFTDRFDAELGAAIYDNVTFLGVNAELWLVRALPGSTAPNFAVRGGVHLAQGDGPDASGVDLTALLSSRLSPNLEFVGSLDYTRRFQDAPAEDFNTVHLVPGVEYRLAQNLDLLAEFGVGLNDEAANYFSAGLAFYLR